MVVISCAFPGCEFMSEDGTEAVACALLQSHAFSHAAVPTAHPAIGPVPTHERQGPILERPHIDFGVLMEEWNVFTRRWRLLKESSGISNDSAPSQLFQCTSKELGDNLLKFDAEIAIRSIEEIPESTRRLAVIPIATGVLKTELMQMRQMRDESFRSFAAQVRGKAGTCAFSANCSCDLIVNCTDHMIRDTLLNGISDFDKRREILGTTDILTTAVNDVIALVESKEMAHDAIPAHDVSVVSVFMRQKATTLSKSCRSSSRNPSPANPSKQFSCSICKKQFHLYKEGPRGWNTKPLTICIDCFHTRGHTKHNNFPSPTSTVITDSSGLLENTGHLGAVTKSAPPPWEEQAKISRQESDTFENAHYVFQNEQWIRAGMLDHPTIEVCVSMDNYGAAPRMPYRGQKCACHCRHRRPN